MIRLFVALDLPEDVRDRLPPPGGDWRAVPRESLHVTLAFLGSRPEEDAAVAAQAVAGALAPVGEMATARAIVLPPRRPRVMAVELEDPSRGCVALQAGVAGALAAAGLYEPERRRWLPHVTIGRARGPAAGGGALPAVPRVEFRPPSVSLYRSHLGRGPARYAALASFELPPG